MPSKISSASLPVCIIGEKKVCELSYCTDAAFDILKSVFPKYRVYKYRDIYLPDSVFDEMHRFVPANGLLIEDAIAPPGTQIVSALDDIKLSTAGAELRMPRNEEDMRLCFRSAIGEAVYYFENYVTRNYLDGYEHRADGETHEFYENRVLQLLDLVKVAFKVENPTVGFLREILGE